ncbi:endonuclease domain-containing protein [Microbacterium sp. JZ101]
MYPTEIAARIDARHGVARASTLRMAGASARDIRRALVTGSIWKVRAGVYATPDVSADIVTAARHGGALCCASALAQLGVWVLDADAIHVAMGPHGRQREHAGCACIPHWDEGATGFGRVDIVRALVQLARCQGDEAFFAAFESAWHRGLLSRRDRLAVRARLDARQRRLVDAARSDSESELESLLRIRLLRMGIVLRCQVRIRTVGRVDFVVGDRIILEVDGRENHDGESHRHRDLVRDANAAALGYRTLRFDYALVIHNWPRVERAIVGALRRTA